METGTTKTFQHRKTFFVFTDKSLFLVPEDEYKRIRQSEDGYVCVERKYLPDTASRDTERVICIVCHEEAAPEDFVSPLCREMHFVLCRECVEDLKKGTDKREVACLYCKEKKSDKAYQEEILGAVLSLMSQHTTSLELRTDTEVETVTRLTRETKVILSNTTISDALFFRLMARTVVEIRSRVSLFGRDKSLGRCTGELNLRTKDRINIFFDGYTDEEMKQVYSNTKTIPKKSIQINAEEIHAKEDGIYVLLKLFAGADRYVPKISLDSLRKVCMEETPGPENRLAWMAKAQKPRGRGYGMQILPKLRLHGESEIEKLDLCVYNPEQIAEILKEENNSIWVGKVKSLELDRYAVEILPKLRLHDENEMEKLEMYAYEAKYIAEILKTENKSILIGKVKSLELRYFAVEALPKLRLHEENVMEELALVAKNSEQATEMLKMENSSICVGKVKNLELGGYAASILPKLGIHEENEMGTFKIRVEKIEDIAEMLKEERKSIWLGKVGRLRLNCHAAQILPKLKLHEENVMEEFHLSVYYPEWITETLKEENCSIWLGKVKSLKLEWYGTGIFRKLRIHEENLMEELELWADKAENISGILKEENNSLWVGKVKSLKLGHYAVGILPKLSLHGENVMEVLELRARCLPNTAEILKMENSSIWVGKVKSLELRDYPIEILPKLILHEENVMEELRLWAKKPGYIAEILKMKNKSIGIGKVRKINLVGHAERIKEKLDFTLIAPDAR
ncbi:MAG: uncharacterized protein A8A55_1474 [Amphiamblys sp. WSBS2006]|nr:MAG: uncharacterized protein A8A55_1474 [Amphiamblys sp. WSBS2006]